MALDLFEDEQKIFDDATKRAEEFRKGGSFDFEEYVSLLNEYGKLLKQLRNHFDVLTGIYNRRFMEDALKRIVRSLSRAQGALSIMMVDVDFFKRYNDTYGHGMGDDCLRAIAYALSKTVERADDFVARYGGEEFVVVLPYTDEAGAELTAVKLLESIRVLRIPHEQSDAAAYVTISIGVTTVKVDYSHHYMEYIKRADEALYVSKQTGRNKYTYLKFNKEGDRDNET